MVHAIRPRLGIVFDIDGLADPMYGFAAYVLLFGRFVPKYRTLLESTRLWDGDTYATLAGERRDYLIAVEARDVAALHEIRRLMREREDRGLKGAAERFLEEDEVAREPLVPAARINELGVMDWCDTSFVRNAWDQANKAAQQPSGLRWNSPGEAASMQRKPD